MTNRPLTLGQTADYLQLSERTVLRYVHSGLLKAYKLNSQYRFDPQDVQALVVVLDAEGASRHAEKD